MVSAVGKALRANLPSPPPDQEHRDTDNRRRAHWHTYLVGPGRRERRLKWLLPIPVNVDDPDALPVTIKPVQPIRLPITYPLLVYAARLASNVMANALTFCIPSQIALGSG